ncbi:MAG: hypothetical protein KGN34_14580 [Sphingomonadales bacterium]|nr:hypothetical protein [Sphingomonadales bacterium]
MSLAMLALFVLAVLQLGVMDDMRGRIVQHLTAISLSPDHNPQKAAPRHQAAKAAKTRAAVTPPVPPVPTPIRTPFKLIELSHADMAAADISRMARHEGTEGSGSGDSKSAYGPGEGPGGARLYNAEWVREPSDAEMRTYMPAQGAAPGSWAIIACKTVEHFHVDNCQQLDESPPGSGLSRALRQAAWQFLVRPPRIDGKAQVGAWVRIRFDFTKGRAE